MRQIDDERHRVGNRAASLRPLAVLAQTQNDFHRRVPVRIRDGTDYDHLAVDDLRLAVFFDVVEIFDGRFAPRPHVANPIIVCARDVGRVRHFSLISSGSE
jgi:hypothetical protein